jgi:hypothetical protein
VFELGYDLDEVVLTRLRSSTRPRSDFPEIYVEPTDRPGVTVVIGPHGVREEGPMRWGRALPAQPDVVLEKLCRVALPIYATYIGAAEAAWRAEAADPPGDA